MRVPDPPLNIAFASAPLVNVLEQRAKSHRMVAVVRGGWNLTEEREAHVARTVDQQHILVFVMSIERRAAHVGPVQDVPHGHQFVAAFRQSVRRAHETTAAWCAAHGGRLWARLVGASGAAARFPGNFPVICSSIARQLPKSA